MLRGVLGFVVATLVGGVLTGVGLTALLPRPTAVATTGLVDPALTFAAAGSADTTPHNLPQWVQTRRVAPLWSGPDQRATQFTTLPAWTFLKVDGAQNDRLHVQYSGRRQRAQGRTRLGHRQRRAAVGRQRRIDAYPSRLTALLRLPWLEPRRRGAAMGVDGQPGRSIQRSPACAGVCGVIRARAGEGWLPSATVGPTDAPVQNVWTAADRTPPAPEFTFHEEFISKVAEAARAFGTDRVPASVTVRKRFSNRAGVIRS